MLAQLGGFAFFVCLFFVFYSLFAIFFHLLFAALYSLVGVVGGGLWDVDSGWQVASGVWQVW